MNAAAIQRDDLMPPQPKGMGPGLLLALLAHGGLIAALAVSVNWRVSEPEGAQAELWAAVPRAAAPRAVEPEPVTAPPPPPPVQRVTPTQPPPRPDADIAEEKEREKAKRDKLKAEEEKKEEAAKKRLQQEQLRQEQLKKDKLKQQELAKKEQAEKDAERKRREASDRVAKQAEKARQDQLKRMAGMAGATGAPNATGTALRSSGASSGYGGRIVAHLKSFAVFSDSIPGNPRTEVEIRVAPSGAIQGTRMLRSSGVPSWDDAVMRTLEKAQRLPLDNDGTVQNPTIISWGPND